MKGKIIIEVDYDSTRIPKGDARYDFVTNVVIDGLSEGLSFKTVQEFKESIAYGINETIALTPDKDTPPEKWPVIDSIWALCYVIEFGQSFDNASGYQNFRNSGYEGRYRQVRDFFNLIALRLPPLTLGYITFENQKVEFISGILFNHLLTAALEEGKHSTNKLSRMSRDEIKTGLHYLLSNQNHKKQYRLFTVCTVLMETYKVLEGELPYFLQFEDYVSLSEALVDTNYIDLGGIAERLNVEPKLLEAHMNAYLLAKENEAR